MTSAFTRLMALGIIAALAVVAVVTIRAIEANKGPYDPPRVGDVDTATTCTWVSNSYTALYAEIVDRDHLTLLPTARVKDLILNGIPDNVTYRFRWYWRGEMHQGIGQETLDLYTSHYASLKRTVRQQFNDAYYIRYNSSGQVGLQMWHENSRFYSPLIRTGTRTGTGDQWAYVRTTSWPDNAHSLLSLDCWHIMPDSTPTGHEPFIEED